MIGMKEKNGRQVPNCVPKTSSSNRMPYHLELGSDGHNFSGKAIVVNTKTGKHYSSEPIPKKKAEAQLRVLKSAEKREKK